MEAGLSAPAPSPTSPTGSSAPNALEARALQLHQRHQLLHQRRKTQVVLSCTRLQRGIRTPKVYTDGTIRYDHIAATSEGPTNLKSALSDDNWKRAMDLEIEALHKNKNGTLYHLRKGET
jgi:hypothetical protein